MNAHARSLSRRVWGKAKTRHKEMWRVLAKLN
jgi:hypothetical protein